MWQFSIAHQRPSCTVASTSSALPRRYPKRAFRSRYGPWFMLSIPPATTISASPALISAAASMIALRPEPQTRLIVVALVESGRPALSVACRAGAWPAPACSTWPMSTSSIASAGTPARSTAAAMAMPPKVVAGTSASAPANLPIGVRAAETRYTAPFRPPTRARSMRSMLPRPITAARGCFRRRRPGHA